MARLYSNDPFGGKSARCWAGKPIINDHIALRTFNIAKVNLDVLAKHFTSLGYVPCGDYKFEQKKLIAKHFEHPDSTQPKVFISELLVEEFSPALQETIQGLIAQVDVARQRRTTLFTRVAIGL